MKSLDQCLITIRIQLILTLRIVFLISKSPSAVAEEAGSLVSLWGSALLWCCSGGSPVSPLSAWLPLKFPSSLTAGDFR